jgi:hypothetical protein
VGDELYFMPGMWVTKVNVEKESDKSEPGKLRRESVESFGHWTQATNPESLLLPKRKRERREKRERQYNV